METVAVVGERYQRNAILEQTRVRALSIGTNLTALCEGYLRCYNFITLEQATEKVKAGNEDAIYAAAPLHDGRVAAFSGRDDLQGKTLDDPVSPRALDATTPLVRDIICPEHKAVGYDVAIPVFVPRSSKKWGTIRIGFSLKRAYELIQQTSRFDPFFTSREQERGLGLGLSVSHGIITEAHGRIDVESEVGKGSTFRISLPASA
jgi:Histidine kinase-, DNA gyrase B-, and HSP90-like ATPase